jgi:hypothetical protein
MLFPLLIVAMMAFLASATPVHQRRELGGVSLRVPLICGTQPLMTSMLTKSQVLLCTGANSTGTCSHVVAPLSSVGNVKCQQLEKPYFKNTATFAPDGEEFECFPRLYSCGEICRSPTGCTFGAVDFKYENKYDLGRIGWDSLIQSFDCSPKREIS